MQALCLHTHCKKKAICDPTVVYWSESVKNFLLKRKISGTILNPMKKPCDRFRFRQQSVQTNLVATAKAMKPCASKGIMIRTPPTPTGGRQLDWFYTLDIFSTTSFLHTLKQSNKTLENYWWNDSTVNRKLSWQCSSYY